jgi:hypothetical protein
MKPPNISQMVCAAGFSKRGLRLFFMAGLVSTMASAADNRIQFNRDIRPILSDNCFSCHGPDKSHRKGDLRLDLREQAIRAGKSGDIAITPGVPQESELLRRVVSEDKDDIMPPPDSHKKLTAAQKSLLEEWIRQGAEYQLHWAYMPPARSEVPRLRDQTLVRNAIDAFVQQKLEAKGVRPSPETGRASLLRRLSLDLSGLPPSVEELAAFEADVSPDAYLRQVERLLASPHFGERMASHWLDVARYADTVGFHGDQNMNVWAYRDWVIAAFNQNMPFDQFTVEQIAGDLLPEPSPEQLTATCFNRLNMVTREGGAQAKEYLTKYTADRVRTVGMAWLGSTFGCAECHDHKFDPISAKDFYSMGAFFADVKQWGVYMSYNYTPEPELAGFSNDFPFPPERVVDSDFLKRKVVSLEAQLAGLGRDEKLKTEEVQKWSGEVSSFLEEHVDGVRRLVPTVLRAPAHQKMEGAEGTNPKHEVSKLELQVEPGAGWIASIVVDLPTSSVPPKGAPKGWLFESDPKAQQGRIKPSGENASLKSAFRLVSHGKSSPLKIRHAAANRFRPDYLNGAEVQGVERVWKLNGLDRDHRALFILDPPLRLSEGDKLVASFDSGSEKAPDYDLSFLGLSVSPLAPLKLGDAVLPEALPGDRSQLALEFLRCTASDARAYAKLKSLEGELLGCRGGKTPVLITKSVEKPLPIRVLPRGNWMDESGPQVLPETPHFLPVLPSSGERRTRMDLAKWLVSDQNPLTARVVMNRMWRQLFGSALSVQTDELGSQGEPPSHPELLDWLALEFRENGWDIKRMVRLLVSSHTYRQSAQLRRELLEMDPQNRLLASQNPRRLEAEIVRDNALAIAGLLNREMGGPPVKPYQPSGYYQAIQFPSRDYLASEGGDQYRRAVYSHWQRTFLHPMLANFDAPSREDCVALRSNANTPQQALTLLNDPSFVEAARFWAARILDRPDLKTDSDRLRRMGLEALSRPLNPEESGSLLALLKKLREEYGAKPQDADRLLRGGQPQTPSRAASAEWAAWTNLCRVVLNLHESITRY